MTARRIVTADGVRLALHRLRESPGRPAALCVHGAFCSHTAWLRVRGGAGGGFADLLDARGYDVWLADLRHHGASEREPKPRTWRFEAADRPLPHAWSGIGGGHRERDRDAHVDLCGR